MVLAITSPALAAAGSGRCDNQDSRFFHDYLALLGTLQPVPRATVRARWESDLRQIVDFRNQVFFNQEQIEKILGWIKEARMRRKVDPSSTQSSGYARWLMEVGCSGSRQTRRASRTVLCRLSRPLDVLWVEVENQRLRKELAKFQAGAGFARKRRVCRGWVAKARVSCAL